MKMKYFVTILSTFLFCMHTHGQVTIGSSERPLAGALLQLKDLPNIEGNAANSTRGLLLPRVALNETASLYPLSETDDTHSHEDHIGAIVFNTTENELICKGLHLWNGNKWEALHGPSIEYIEDVRISKIDGHEEKHIYPAQNFGEAGTWTLTNMRATMYSDGTPIDEHDATTKVNKEDKLYYYPPVNSDAPINYEEDKAGYKANKSIYGLIYTWSAAARRDPTPSANEGEGIPREALGEAIANEPNKIQALGTQGVCPDGWHLPSDKEMNDLEKVFSNDQSALYYDSDLDPNYKPILWNDSWRISQLTRGSHGRSYMSPYTKSKIGLSRNRCGGLIAGFSAYPVGYINLDNEGKKIDILGDYWTASKGMDQPNGRLLEYRAWYRSFMNLSTDTGVTRRSMPMGFFMSVRCKKN